MQTGINKDLHPLINGENNLLYALNAMVEDRGGSQYLIGNEPSNELGTLFPVGMQVIGSLWIQELERVLVWLAPLPQPAAADACGAGDAFTRNGGEIGEIRLNAKNRAPYYSYTPLLPSSCLGFSVHYPVTPVYRLTDNRLALYWVDGYNEDRYLYFQFTERTLTRTLTLHPQFGTETDVNCNKISFSSRTGTLSLSVMDLTAGGVLLSGSYQIWAAYSDEGGNPLTSYVARTGMIPVADRKVVSQTGYQTGKAIKLSISADTTTYRYYTLAVLRITNEQTEVVNLGAFPTTQGEYLLTGSETFLPGSLDTLLLRKTYYTKSAGITTAEGKLLRYGVEERVKPNFQRCFLNLPVYWQTTQLPEGAYADGAIASQYRGFMRDEVVPLGLVLETHDGEDYPVIHLPGRVAKLEDLAPIGIENLDSAFVREEDGCTPNRSVKTWEVYNTARVLQKPREPYQPCKETVWEWGEMGYWESTLLYPNRTEIWGNLANTPIRHHKLPDSRVTHIHDGLEGNKGFRATGTIYPLGFRVIPADIRRALDIGVQNCWITPEQRSSIRSFRIVRGDRTGNASVLGRGLLFDTWEYTKEKRTFTYANYPLNDLRPDGFLTPSVTDQTTTTVGQSYVYYREYTNPNSPGEVQRYGPYDTGEEAQAQIPDPPNDTGWSVVTVPIGTVEGGTTVTKSVFTPQGRYTFHSPEVHFTSPGLPTHLQLETEEYGTTEGFFSECKGEAKQKVFNRLARILISAAVERAKKQNFLNTIFKTVFATSTVDTGITPTTPEQFRVTVPYSGNNKTSTGPLPDTVTYTASVSIPGVDSTIINNLLRVANNPTGIEGLVKALNYFEIFNNLFSAAAPWVNYALQFQTVGNYNNYRVHQKQGDQIRSIKNATMLEPEMQTVVAGDGTTLTVNNRDRERSLFIQTSGGTPLAPRYLPAPTKPDTSRYTLGESPTTNVGDRETRTCSSFYATLKAYNPSQYGTLDTVRYLETGGKSTLLSSNTPVNVWGGDTFIGRMSLKRKHRFFTQNRFDLPDGINTQYEKMGNVGNPTFFYNTFTGIMSEDNLDLTDYGANFFVLPKYRLDRQKNSGIYDKGYIYLYSYGIPYFFCESAVNLDLRHADERVESGFYPVVGDLEEWLQERTVSIREDNRYLYDRSFSRSMRENTLTTTPSNIEITPLMYSYPNRVIYSPEGLLGVRDPWLTYRALDYYDFDYSLGELVGLTNLSGPTVLARFKRGSAPFNAVSTLQVGDKTVQLGDGGMFAQKPVGFVRVDGAYGGSSHKAILRTEYGSVWVDAPEGKVFLQQTGGGMDELNNYGFYHWFRENLPFKLKESFPALPLDNAYWGAGIILGYDERMKRILLTKKDYKPRSKNITYNPRTRQFMLNGQEVFFFQPEYFIDLSWTASFHLNTKTWIFHSYTPDYYLGLPVELWAGKNSKNAQSSSVWVHGKTLSSYQTYFGKTYPYMLEEGRKWGENSYLWDIRYNHEVREYFTPQEFALKEGITYNRMVVYNDYQTTGLLDLVPSKVNSQRDRVFRPIRTVEKTTVKCSADKDGVWTVNQLEDRKDTTNQPIWTYTPSQHVKWPNDLALSQDKAIQKRGGSLRSKSNRVCFINDAEFRYRFIHLFTQPTQYPSLK